MPKSVRKHAPIKRRYKVAIAGLLILVILLLFQAFPALAAIIQSVIISGTPDYSNSPPTVNTGIATNVTAHTATLHGSITDTGGHTVDERGFEWDIDSGEPYTYIWTEHGSYGVDNFSRTVDSLPSEMTMYHRAIAHNDEGWSYGDEESFVTSENIPITIPLFGFIFPLAVGLFGAVTSLTLFLSSKFAGGITAVILTILVIIITRVIYGIL